LSQFYMKKDDVIRDWNYIYTRRYYIP